MPARCTLDELPGDAHTVARDPDASFQDITNAEFARDLLHVGRSAPVGKRRIAGDYKETAIARQGGDDVFDDSVDEIVRAGVSAQIDERQYGDRRPFGCAT